MCIRDSFPEECDPHGHLRLEETEGKQCHEADQQGRIKLHADHRSPEGKSGKQIACHVGKEGREHPHTVCSFKETIVSKAVRGIRKIHALIDLKQRQEQKRCV